MKKKNKYKTLYVFLLCVLLLSISNDAFAQSKGSVQLKASVDNNGNDYKLSNTKFIMYQVGVYKNGTGDLQADFADSGVTFDFEDSSIQGSDAQKLEEYAKENQIQGTAETTNSNGEILFDNLDRGIYLFVQPEKTYLGNQAYQSEAFIVSVPGYYDGQIIWNVVAEPKFKNESIPVIVTRTPPVSEEPPSNDEPENHTSTDHSHTGKVKTGDDTNIFQWFLLMGTSALTVLLYTSQKKKQKNGKML